MPSVDLSALPVRALLRLYADLLSELGRRGVVRSRNAPAGDLGEFLVARAFDGTLAPASAKSWDVLTGDQRRLQVKTRLVAPASRAGQFSPFRSFDFDACVFLRLDVLSYDVLSAVEVPKEAVERISQEVKWVAGRRIGVGAPLLSLPAARDVTALLSAALAELDVPLPVSGARDTARRSAGGYLPLSLPTARAGRGASR